MKLQKTLLMALLALSTSVAFAGEPWRTFCKEVAEIQIKSSADGKMQDAILYKASKPNRPLVVHMHAWSATFQNGQEGVLRWAQLHDYNYVYPNFRGPNNTPEGMCSPLTITDIEDVIDYCLKNTGADPKEVHLMGSSGGGTAVMNCYMRLKYPVKSFWAAVGIYDIEAYYYSVLTRHYDEYARHIERATNSYTHFDVEEIHRRSPYYMPYKPELREGSTLSLYAGVNDGYVADVPITQTLLMYNKIAKEKYPNNPEAQVPESEIIKLLTLRCDPWAPEEIIGGKKVHLHKRFGDIEVAIYEAGHGGPGNDIDMLGVYDGIKRQPYTFVAIGDDNAVGNFGWANQLNSCYPYAWMIDTSAKGRTLGVSTTEDNTLRVVEPTLESIRRNPDYILISLGTNDAKAVYAPRAKEYTAHLKELIAKVKGTELYKRCSPEIILIGLPPIEEALAGGEFAGAAARATEYDAQMKKVAAAEGLTYIDTRALLAASDRLPKGEFVTSDGITLTPMATRVVIEGLTPKITKEK